MNFFKNMNLSKKKVICFVFIFFVCLCSIVLANNRTLYKEEITNLREYGINSYKDKNFLVRHKTIIEMRELLDESIANAEYQLGLLRDEGVFSKYDTFPDIYNLATLEYEKIGHIILEKQNVAFSSHVTDSEMLMIPNNLVYNEEEQSKIDLISIEIKKLKLGKNISDILNNEDILLEFESLIEELHLVESDAKKRQTDKFMLSQGDDILKNVTYLKEIGFSQDENGNIYTLSTYSDYLNTTMALLIFDQKKGTYVFKDGAYEITFDLEHGTAICKCDEIPEDCNKETPMGVYKNIVKTSFEYDYATNTIYFDTLLKILE